MHALQQITCCTIVLSDFRDIIDEAYACNTHAPNHSVHSHTHTHTYTLKHTHTACKQTIWLCLCQCMTLKVYISAWPFTCRSRCQSCSRASEIQMSVHAWILTQPGWVRTHVKVSTYLPAHRSRCQSCSRETRGRPSQVIRRSLTVKRKNREE